MSTLLYHMLILMVMYGTVVPVVGVVAYGFGGSGNKETSYYILRAITYLANSLKLAIPVTLLATLLAIILSFALWRISFVGQRIARITVLAPLLNPPFVGSLSFIMLFGKRGLITHDLLNLTVSPFGYWGVFVMQVIGLTTLGYMFISSGLRRMQTLYEEAARVSGASEWTILRTVTLPLLKPEIIGGMLLIFLASMADFGTPLIIGGPFQTLSSDLYIQITGVYDMKAASISGAILLIPCLMAFLWQQQIMDKRNYWGKENYVTRLQYTNVHCGVKILLMAICFIFQFILLLKYGFIVIGP